MSEKTDAMTEEPAATLRQLLADVPREKYHERMTGPKDVERPEFWDWVADALLASHLADMLDMAQWWVVDNPVKAAFANPEVVALLQSWSRAERPTP